MSLEPAARLAWQESRVKNAALLLGAAAGLRDEAGVPIWGVTPCALRDATGTGPRS